MSFQTRFTSSISQPSSDVFWAENVYRKICHSSLIKKCYHTLYTLKSNTENIQHVYDCWIYVHVKFSWKSAHGSRNVTKPAQAVIYTGHPVSV